MTDTLWHNFQSGGWAMWVILFWLTMTLLLSVERFLYLVGAYQQTEVFIATLHQCLLGTKDTKRAISMCLAAKSPLARIIMGGLREIDKGQKGFQAGMDAVALRELPKISKHVQYFATFANLSMLSGLFGTIIGLIKSFGAVGGESVDASQKARILAEGIAEAMNCTAFGLLAAIIALMSFATFSSWVSNIESSIHRETVHIYNLVVETYYRE